MAHIINELTGRVRGKVGNLVYRITNGNTALCALPTNRVIDNSPAAVVRKSRFRIVVKFSKAINSLLSLKHFWKIFSEETIDLKKSAFNKIVKKNYKRVSGTTVLDTAYMVPYYGFNADASEVAITDNAITVEIDALGTSTGIDLNIEKQIAIQCVVCLSAPVILDDIPVAFFSGESGKITLNLTNPMSFSITLVDAQSGLINAYAGKKVFLALVTYDDDGLPVRYSNTFIYV